ncbi:DNA circularization N-terminal domain-containing protein [Pectobacteriaceae bacterium C52]|nr:DNA circularization N-terminal domain-containing protein [Pectobacteriaceae bacterium C52]WJY16361.1 DNA circularization N-terminal domain-containing protein [Pectobacteriaceae bacterium CE90]
MSWKDYLQDASLRGVPFKVSSDEARFGRRVQVHEYPNRDKPYSEDLGRATRRFSVDAYVIGDDFMIQRNKLINEIEKAGAAKLIHPYYGEMSITIDEPARLAHADNEGRMCRISFSFVEAGELSFPISGLATNSKLTTSTSWLEDFLSGLYDDFGLDGLSDFISDGVISDAESMIDEVTNTFRYIDQGVTAASRLLRGDMSVILSGGGSNLFNRLQTMWRSANRLTTNAKSLVSLVTNLTGVTTGHDLSPRGTWKTNSKTTNTRVTNSNTVAHAIRTSALIEAVYAVTSLPKSKSSITAQLAATNGSVGTATSKNITVSHPAVTDIDVSDTITTAGTTTSTTVESVPSWSDLHEIRTTINVAIDKELERTTDDQLFQALVRVRADVNNDITSRLTQTARLTERTTNEVLPALVLAADWYDDAGRADEIVSRNNIIHPGFVPVTTLTVPAK